MRTITRLNIKPYCTCIETGTWKKQDGWVQDFQSGLWVHSRCRKLSFMNYNRVVLGKRPYQEQRVIEEDDIYKIELRYEARKIVDADLIELGWVDEDETDEELEAEFDYYAIEPVDD